MKEEKTVRQRLLDAALECFLADEYQNVTTRQIAALAGANVSMIRYYFGSKEGLFEEMIRSTLAPLLDVLDGDMLSSSGGFEELFQLYYRIMTEYPEFPKLELKILALNQGPGRRFILELLERGRSRSTHQVEALKAAGKISDSIDPDMLRLTFISLAMTPMLLKGIFEEQLGRTLDSDFLARLASLNGHLLAAGLATWRDDKEETR